MLSFYFHSFMNLFVIIDPIALVPIFLGLTYNHTLAERRKIAFRACTISAITLVLFAYLGENLLHVMGISQPAFQVAGGLLLLLAAIEMAVGAAENTKALTSSEEKEISKKADITVFPLAIPLIAGPGTMTSIVLHMEKINDWFYEGILVVIMLFVILLTYFCLYSADAIKRLLGPTGSHVITRVFGIILAALATEFILKGIKAALFS